MVKLRPRFLEFDFESRNRSPSGKSLVRKYPAFFDHAIPRNECVVYLHSQSIPELDPAPPDPGAPAALFSLSLSALRAI